MINAKLKGRMLEREARHKDVAGDLGINARVFGNKLNHRKQPNGNVARFTESERLYLAVRFDVDTTDIE